MAFALVEFADKSLAVVETANITTAAGEKVTDCGQDCVVEWRGPGKKKKVATKHAATVIKFGGMYNSSPWIECRSSRVRVTFLFLYSLIIAVNRRFTYIQ